MTGLSAWWRHPVVIERFLADTAYGPSYDAPETVEGFVEDGSKLVSGPNGATVTSTARIALPLATAYVPPKSRVTLPATFGGRLTTVIGVAVGDGGGQPVPGHIELAVA